MSALVRATCLGCGCVCDDLFVVTDGTRVTAVQTECPLAPAWYEGAQHPHAIRIDGLAASLEDALAAVATRLLLASQPLVIIGSDATCETQRCAVALADLTRARLDTLTGAHASATATAVQQFGRVSATLGEFGQRADLVIFWGVDPQLRFPRLRARFLTESRGEQSAARTAIAVDFPGRRGPADCAHRIALDTADELETLRTWAALLSVTVNGSSRPDLTTSGLHVTREEVASTPAAALADAVRRHRYVAVVVDGESGGSTRAHLVAGAFNAVARGINDVTRGGLCTLRDGGNRNGADAVLTWQTGYPMQVDFAYGHPRYGITSAEPPDVTLVIGRDDVPARPAGTGLLAIGPGASRTAAHVAIDTGTAGIQEGGLAYRMDDVPVPLRALVSGPPRTSDVLQQLIGRCGAVR